MRIPICIAVSFTLLMIILVSHINGNYKYQQLQADFRNMELGHQRTLLVLNTQHTLTNNDRLLWIAKYKALDTNQRTLTVRMSAYTASVDETDEDPENTAIMESPIPGYSCAVSRDLKYLLGKTVYIEKYGIRRVNDLMNQRYVQAIDLLVPTKAYARQVGVQQIEIVIVSDLSTKPMVVSSTDMSNDPPPVLLSYLPP